MAQLPLEDEWLWRGARVAGTGGGTTGGLVTGGVVVVVVGAVVRLRPVAGDVAGTEVAARVVAVVAGSVTVSVDAGGCELAGEVAISRPVPITTPPAARVAATTRPVGGREGRPLYSCRAGMDYPWVVVGGVWVSSPGPP
jgi:hypothetical protein